MEKDKEKAMYESPVTKETQVVLESGICASSVIKDNESKENATIEGHEVNTGFGSGGFTDQGWDEIN